MNKRFSVSTRIYDSIPVMFVSFVLRIAGGIMWFAGIVSLVTAIYNLIVYRVFGDVIGAGPFSFVYCFWERFLYWLQTRLKKKQTVTKYMLIQRVLLRW